MDFRCHDACIRAKIYVISYLLPVNVFDFQHAQTSNSILISLSVLSDPENTDIAVGILLLSCVKLRFTLPSLQIRQLGFLTSAHLLPAHQHQYSISGMSVLDHVCFAVAIVPLPSVELKM